MTTTIIVNAHCADTKEVKVNYNVGNGDQEEIIQDGENFETYIHEPKHIVSVSEVDKVTATMSGPGGCERGCD